jgi:hypothetical protein
LPGKYLPRGILDFTNTHVGHLDDDWSKNRYRARLAGLCYDTLSERASVLSTRLEWLASALPQDGAEADGIDQENADGEYLPQAYEQFAAALRRAGCDEDAREVFIAKERERRKHLGHRRPWRRKIISHLWSLLLGIFGYGYKIQRAAVPLIFLWLLGWRVFSRASAHHEMIAVGPTATPPPFHPSLYSLEAVLPVVDFGQRACGPRRTSRSTGMCCASLWAG